MADFFAQETVLLLTVSADFKAQSPWNVPDVATGAKVLSRRLTMDQAAGFVLTHNRAKMTESQQNHTPVTEWAVVVKRIKPRYLKYERRCLAKGGVR